MTRHRSAATRAEVEKLFRSDEEREVRERLKKEISESKRTCMEAMSALVLANHTGEKMDIIKDMLKRSSKFGSVTDKQHEYAASIITKSHMDHLLDIMARVDAGEDTVELAPVAEVKAEPKPERKRIEMTATELNPNFGIF